jgi:hypothetical protein
MSKFARFMHQLVLPHEANNQRAKILHPSSWALLLVGLLIFQSTLSLASKAFPSILGYAASIPPEEIVRLTNVQRANQGLATLTLNSQLSAAAAQKASDMFAKGYWAHVSPSGIQPWYFITESGYSYRYAGENLARDFTEPATIVDAWMDSPSHKENLLNAKYQDIGIAVVDGTLNGQETTLVVQLFGTKLSAAKPAVAKVELPNIAVKAAQDESPLPTQIPVRTISEPTISPFSLTKIVSLVLLAIMIVVLVIDIIEVRKKRIVRWTSKSMAHLVFLVFLGIAAVIMYAGRIM